MREKILSPNQAKIYSEKNLDAKPETSRTVGQKKISNLQKLEDEIIAAPEGSQSSNIHDTLHPSDFPGRQSKIHYFSEVDSTMTKAKELASQGCPDFTVAIAEKQSQGRGRLGRDWRSEKGGLYFTIILRPNIAPTLMSRVSFAASISLAQTLKDITGVDAGIKWPNDILIQGKKVSGMLCEMGAEGSKISYLNIGIGLNVNNEPPELEAKYAAVSLKQILGKEISRKKILAMFLDKLEDKVNNHPLDQSIVDEWKKHAVSLDRQVQIVLSNETVSGLALDVDELGALILKKEDGSLQKVFFGDCFHL